MYIAVVTSRLISKSVDRKKLFFTGYKNAVLQTVHSHKKLFLVACGHDNLSVSASTMLITYFWNNWRYSNAPEGQRPFEKIVGLSKYGLFGSVGMGIYDCILISQTTGFWRTVNCMAFWTIPITSMCATFASVAYTTTKIRGKDGYLNYILACTYRHIDEFREIDSYLILFIYCSISHRWGLLSLAEERSVCS